MSERLFGEVRSVLTKLNPASLEFVQNSKRVLQLDKRLQLLANVVPIKLVTLSHNHSFYIDPILPTCCDDSRLAALLNNLCCSTKPDQGFGAYGGLV